MMAQSLLWRVEGELKAEGIQKKWAGDSGAWKVSMSFMKNDHKSLRVWLSDKAFAQRVRLWAQISGPTKQGSNH